MLEALVSRRSKTTPDHFKQCVREFYRFPLRPNQTRSSNCGPTCAARTASHAVTTDDIRRVNMVHYRLFPSHADSSPRTNHVIENDC